MIKIKPNVFKPTSTPTMKDFLKLLEVSGEHADKERLSPCRCSTRLMYTKLPQTRLMHTKLPHATNPSNAHKLPQTRLMHAKLPQTRQMHAKLPRHFSEEMYLFVTQNTHNFKLFRT